MTGHTSSVHDPERLAQLADYDELTGLPNRVLLADRVEVAVAQAKRYEHLVALVVIDLNKNAEVRAALGIEAGEELTRMVAEHLRIFARKSDTLATSVATCSRSSCHGCATCPRSSASPHAS